MTEHEWLECTDPGAMLEFLRNRASDRKLRLFVCACCRTVWRVLHKRGRKAVTTAEAFVDGLITEEALAEAERGLWNNGYYLAVPRSGSPAAQAAARHAARAARAVVLPHPNWPSACDDVANAGHLTADSEQAPLIFRGRLASLLREIIGHPFHPVALDPSWRTAQALAVARGAYEDGTFEDLPLLADVLEEAGCGDPELLGHLRGPGPHVRGCWALDLVLGKE
ncbi:MAG: hypothetical protein L0Z62_34380 [Gemmataceae bacterium]|nr:hypothetical protein [Gemmataceae bacterium]